MKIIKLDESVQNLIAAGEVVERPLSIVKELVENSIDAGADTITVTLVSSGTSLIRVSDNGKGMDKEDARMCIERHATSKLHDKNDLFSISSLGFRGEALASIASISNFTLSTSNGVENTMVHVKGGKLIEVKEIPFNKGTEISVENMFYNTPARLKFLKSEAFELSLVTDFLSKISLAYEGISFKLINNNKVILHTTRSNDIFKTLSEVYTVEVARKMNHLTFSNYDYKVDAYFSSPELTRSNKNNITIIVNNRVVKNYLITNKLIEAYKEKLFAKRYPIAVLKITCDPLLVDVNVHPSKQELKYTDEYKLLDLIFTNVNNFLFNKVESNYEVDHKPKIIKNDIIDQVINFDKEEEVSSINPQKSYVEVTKSYDFSETKQKTYDFDSTYEPSHYEDSRNDYHYDPNDFDMTVEEEYQNPFNSNNDLSFNKEESKTIEESLEGKKETTVHDFPKLDYIGQVFHTYLLFEGNDGFYIVDQHAAAERINYELYYDKLHRKTNDYYELLVPIVLDFDLAMTIKIRENLEEIKSLGVNIDEISEKSFVLRSVPTWFRKNKEKDMALEIINNVCYDKSEDMLDHISASLACKASLKGNHFVSEIEVETMMNNLKKCKNPYNCPHGRPTMIKYSKYELERMFKRA